MHKEGSVTEEPDVGRGNHVSCVSLIVLAPFAVKRTVTARGSIDRSIIVSPSVYTENAVPGGIAVSSPFSNNHKAAMGAQSTAVLTTNSDVVYSVFPFAFFP